MTDVPRMLVEQNRGRERVGNGHMYRGGAAARRRLLSAEGGKTCVCARATAGETEKGSNGGCILRGWWGALVEEPAGKSEEIPRAAREGDMSAAAYVTRSPHISVGSSRSSAHHSITSACLSRPLGPLVLFTGNTGFGLPFCWFADRWRRRTLFPPSPPSSSDPPMSC